MILLRVALAAALCSRAALAQAPPPTAPPEQAVASNMTPDPVLEFVDGPALADPVALLAWLQGTQRRMLQLPVVVDFGDAYRLGVKRAWIGTAGDEPPAGAVLLKLDDTSMSVSMMDGLRQVCPEGRQTCAVWIQGLWGPVLERGGAPALSLPGFDSGPRRHDLTVRKVLGLADPSATRVRIERG